MKKVLTYIVKSVEVLIRTGYLLLALAIILAVSYLVGGYAYLSGAWGTDTQSYIYIVSFIKNLFDLNLISALSVVGYGSIIVVAVTIYAFVALRFKNQTAALIAAICYLISPISWTWLTNWGFYAESISHTFVVPTILFFDLFFSSVIKKDYGVKTRLYLFFTILFITLTTATHFLSGYAVMGIFYFYVVVYFLFSKGERKSVLINGIIALFIVGILSLTATSAFTTPFARYAKFASIGGVGSASPPTIKDYQQVLPSIRNIVGLDEIQRGTFLHGMKFFKFPVVVSVLAFMGVLFYSWKDKRKWVYSLYGLFGIFLAFSPYYYVYFLNKLPLGFIASSFGWRPMYAVMRMVIPILAGLGLVGLFSLPFFWIKNKIIRYPINITIAFLSLIAFAFVLIYTKPTLKPIVYNYGANGIDTKNIWGVRDADGNMIGFDICPGKDFESDEERINFEAKFEKVGGWQRWCNSAMKKYFPPSQVVSWCDLEEKKGNTLPVICSPETVTPEDTLQFWESCKDGKEQSEVCKYAYFNLEEQLEISAWPRLKLATGFNPNEGLNQQLEIIEKDNPDGRIDFSPFMGGDSMMTPLYNVTRNLSQIHIYVASASLIHRFQGFQQIVYYLNSPMYDDPEMVNDINKWFGINYVSKERVGKSFQETGVTVYINTLKRMSWLSFHQKKQY
ncbi:MAG: hypothetical protein UT00_C0024G0007 [Parcubacteria group bacterium GW2011_GWA1_38_7]|nr:MAG: hypothetical protein UT00_C0024G0007 [Parcubacteria group bacterium GW2011_GWA1_38_7]